MSNTFQYLKFWITAANQHGVHSPFIYSFVTNGLYTKRKYSGSKTLNIFFKCINYFKPNSIGLEEGNELLRNKVKKEFPSISFKEPFDIVYYGKLIKESQIREMAHYAKQQPKGIIYISEIRKNRSSEQLWNKLILEDFVMVSVDMYFGGLLFFHKTQAREHFRIRI